LGYFFRRSGHVLNLSLKGWVLFFWGEFWMPLVEFFIQTSGHTEPEKIKKKLFLRGSLKFYVHVGTYKSLHYGAKSKLINTSFFSSANLAIDRNIFYCCWKVVVPTVLNVYFMTFSCMCLAFNPMKKPSVHSNWSIFGQKLLGGVPR
jgi:hypothetical protein